MRNVASYRRIPKKAIKIDLPNATQVTDYTCGASALQSICAYFGVGPEDEGDFETEMGMPKTGADPIHITTAAKRYGLEVRELRPMTARTLEKYLDKRRPVILMLQAWSGRAQSYAHAWDEGHYVVAIGYDDDVFYVEDPSLHGSRGFLRRDELDARWHDIEGDDNHHTDRLGIAIWKNKPTKLGYHRAARHVD
ncbi:MAG: C39 family peptidase [Kofleriaceae bacterium]